MKRLTKVPHANCCHIATGVTVFTWLGSITSASYFMVWIVICISSYRFRAALKAQDDQYFSEPYAWKMWAYPFTPLYTLTICALLLISCIYSGLYSLVCFPHALLISLVLTFTQGSTSPSVYDFFEYMIGVLLIVGSYIGYKLVFRTKIRNLEDIDLRSGRRVLSEKEINLLRDYYAKPAWRRGLSYFQVW